MNTIRSVCVYCGSSPGRDEVYMKAGHALGRSIAQSGLRLIYGGGTKGIMGAVSDGALRAGGKVTGIIPHFLLNKEATETALGRLDELIVTDSIPPAAEERRSGKIVVLSIAELMAKAIRNIHEEASVTSLFV